jgi:hypothetical protein
MEVGVHAEFLCYLTAVEFNCITRISVFHSHCFLLDPKFSYIQTRGKVTQSTKKEVFCTRKQQVLKCPSHMNATKQKGFKSFKTAFTVLQNI